MTCKVASPTAAVGVMVNGTEGGSRRRVNALFIVCEKSKGNHGNFITKYGKKPEDCRN